MSNAHRAAESAASGSNLRDDLDVVITLNSVSVVRTLPVYACATA